MAENLEDLKQRFTTPALITEKDMYHIKFASTPEEVLAAQRLRYRVFNEEQGKGLNSANADGIDRDEFDEYCLHLIVLHNDEEMPVGTYRINIGPMTDPRIGYYSAREFEINGFEELRPKMLEVGRSCVWSSYRNGTVVALLWAGISETLGRTGMHYLTGCASLEDPRPAAAWAAYEYLKANGKLSEIVTAQPRPEFTQVRPAQEEIDAILQDRMALRKVMPPLLKGYLRMGAKICGPPAYDYEFGTWDLLILLDTNHLPERYNKHFNVPEV